MDNELTQQSDSAGRESSDPNVVAAAYDAWLGDDGTVVSAAAPDGTGYSSLTYILDVERPDGRRREVLRSVPSGPAVFRTYDLGLQVACLRQLSGVVPTPEVLAHEPDPGPLGSPFYVMSHVEGRIPSDNPPYSMVGWLKDADPALQGAHYNAGIDLIAALGSTRPADVGMADVLTLGPGSGLDQQLAVWQDLLEWGREGSDQPTIDAAWAWLHAHRPEEFGRDVVMWGDARISNVVFGEDGTPRGVLDWEMAGTGPGEIDLAWFLWMDRQFTVLFGAPRLDGFPGEETLINRWQDAVGHEAQSLNWFLVFAGVRFAQTMMRVALRAKAVGAVPADSDVDRNNLATRLLARELELPEPGEMGLMG